MPIIRILPTRISTSLSITVSLAFTSVLKPSYLPRIPVFIDHIPSHTVVRLYWGNHTVIGPSIKVSLKTPITSTIIIINTISRATRLYTAITSKALLGNR